MNEIKIGGREIPLYYSTYEMAELQDEIGCTAFQLKEEVFGIVQEDEDDPMSIRIKCATDPEKTKKLGKLIAILGNAGLEEKGEEPDLTAKWVLRNMKPAMISAYALAAMAVIAEGNRVEAPRSEEEQGPVDEGLEEQTAKKPQGN
jgi:hypothetical protein